MPEIRPNAFPWHRPDQALRFDAFMQAALHDPERGYYGRRIREIGHRGDFSTSSSLGHLLARGITSWARMALKRTSCRNLIEIGPGNGALAREILSGFPRFRKPRLHLVESSPPLRDRQQKTLDGFRVCWHPTLSDALAACEGAACLYSNELVDAFPVRRFRREPGGWSEQFLLPTTSVWEPAEDFPDSSAFDRHWEVGQVIEVHESYHQWLSRWLPAWSRGRMLTIDYGARVEDLYDRQPHGSLRAYFHHQCLSGAEAWSRPGHQDLTADVNFTDLERWTSDFGATCSLQTQEKFLKPFRNSSEAADQFLTDVDGAGTAFLVHEFERRI